MKLNILHKIADEYAHFSTLDSGLRDETDPPQTAPHRYLLISVPSTRVYAMKRRSLSFFTRALTAISVPSTRVYAMKLLYPRHKPPAYSYFSTLDSGLRDETNPEPVACHFTSPFQYPRLGSTR